MRLVLTCVAPEQAANEPIASVEPVAIREYDPRWPRIFESIRAPLTLALGDLADAVEHVGSTAVPGLAAKPIIDIDVVIRRRSDLAAVVERLAGLDYTHEGDLGIRGREAFRPPADLPAHHLYVCARHALELKRHVAFRDRLRTDERIRNEYAELKRVLSARHADDRAAYTQAKSEFIERVLVAHAAFAGDSSDVQMGDDPTV